nr:reverse transcriptase domain-containing protein [Tanacetum cinerariifolium]
MFPVTQTDTFYNGLTLRHRDTINAAAGGTFMKRRPEECYDLIENMTTHHNDWDTSSERSESSSSITSSSDTENSSTESGNGRNQQKSYESSSATVGQTQNVYAAGANQGGNTITIPKEDLKGVTTRSGIAYQGPMIPTTSSFLPKVVECEIEVTKDTMHPTNNGSTKDIQPPTGRALIDVFEGELTLHVGKEAITFNVDQTSRYSANYNDMTADRIDIIDMAYGEYSLEVLGFSDMIASGNPTPYYDPIVSTSSLILTPFRDSDFLLEEVDAFLALEDDPTSSEVDQSYFDPEGDILLLEAFINDDPSLPPPNQGNYLPQVRKELKIYEVIGRLSILFKLEDKNNWGALSSFGGNIATVLVQ